MRSRVAIWVVVWSGCFPTLEDAPSLVNRPRLLAVRAQPAEVRPGEAARYAAFLATQTGSVADDGSGYAFCLQPRVLEERNGVAPDCLEPAGSQLAGLDGPEGIVPLDICARFGSVPPPSEPDQPPFRPVDPDVTGGYYLPVRVQVDGTEGRPAEFGFGFQRIRCDLAGAPIDVAREFARTYEENLNPTIASFTVDDRASPAPLRVPEGQAVRVAVAWPADSAQTYPFFDPITVELRDRIESMAISWFATGGTFILSRSEVPEERASAERSVENVWIAPDDLGDGLVDVWLGVVLRDARGGVDWRSVRVIVGGGSS